MIFDLSGKHGIPPDFSYLCQSEDEPYLEEIGNVVGCREVPSKAGKNAEFASTGRSEFEFDSNSFSWRSIASQTKLNSPSLSIFSRSQRQRKLMANQIIPPLLRCLQAILVLASSAWLLRSLLQSTRAPTLEKAYDGGSFCGWVLAVIILVVLVPSTGRTIRFRSLAVRFLQCAFIAIVTAVSCILPMLVGASDSWLSCTATLHSALPEGKIPQTGDTFQWTYALVCFATVVVATALTSTCVVDLPSSAFACAIRRCLCAFWLMLVGLPLYAGCMSCGSPTTHVAAIAGVGRGIQLGLHLPLQLWVLWLIIKRLGALERGFGRSLGRQRVKRNTACGFAILFFTALVLILVKDSDYVTASVDFILALIHLELAWRVNFILSSLLPVLSMEAKRVNSLPRAEALWAVGGIRRERVATVATLLTTALRDAIAGVKYTLHIAGSSEASISVINHGVAVPLDAVTNALAFTILVGALWRRKPEARKLEPLSPIGRGDAMRSHVWQKKVIEMANRGIRLEDLLTFMMCLGKNIMPQFDARTSTTNCVVRQAIIPLSRRKDNSGGVALATVFNEGKERLANCMVTHNWSNLFVDLLAAIFADALGTPTWADISLQMQTPYGLTLLRMELEGKGLLDRTYWVCALCINQHAGICGGFGPSPPSEDVVRFNDWSRKTKCAASGEIHALCHCAQRKIFNSDDADLTELNKFDDMMAFMQLEQGAKFYQLIALDRAFEVFMRVWCVAEIVQAATTCVEQRLALHSDDVVNEHYARLAELDVSQMEATRKEDKEAILAKIADVNLFNEYLITCLFGQGGLFSSFLDGADSLQMIGSIARRAAAAQETRLLHVAVGA